MKRTLYALITGASSGIGLELARLFAADAIPLLLVARRTDRLVALKEELEQKHAIAIHIFCCDLADESARAQLLAALQAQQLTIGWLVNNAGIGQYGSIADNAWQQTDQMLKLNMLAPSHLTRALLPSMLQHGFGRILNIASTAAFQPGPGMAAYFASKAYLLSYSEALAFELTGSGVSATCLCPGATQSEFFTAATMEDSGLVKGKRLPSAASVAALGYRAMQQGKALAIHGLFNRLRIQSLRVAPRRIVTAVTAAILKSSA